MQVRSIGSGSAVEALRDLGVGPGTPVGLAFASDGVGFAVGPAEGLACSAAEGAGIDAIGGVDVVRRVLHELRPRLVWWSAREAAPLVRAGVAVRACWDVGATHRLCHGGFEQDPAVVWAVAAGLDPDRRPHTGQLDLLGDAVDAAAAVPESRGIDPDGPVGPDGYLRPGWVAGAAPAAKNAAAAAEWAAAAMTVRDRHEQALLALRDSRPGPAPPHLAVLTAWSESAAELLAAELGACGLPFDRATATALIEERVGPPPADANAAAAGRAARDDAVRGLVRDAAEVDLRNPGQVRRMLAGVGIDLADTRSWRLEPFREAHPVVAALLAWRKAERIATTYGFGWLDRDLGADGRLRGRWTGCDGAAGRMTASAGLHNMPAELRPAVLADAGHRFVRADLGQIEPRVLATVSGDPGLAAATAADDLYAPVAARLGVDRKIAKVAVLAAMYGQTSGTAGEALRGLDRAYPVAMAFLRSADDAGRAGREVLTYGGRRVPMWPLPEPIEPAAAAARGRFARNAVVQGAAAEVFKMWAVSVRAALPAAAEIVLCLHDELLVHAPDEDAGAVAALLHETLAATGLRWAGGTGVRLVADVLLVSRWSDVADDSASTSPGAYTDS